jgi:hypothetical protein
MLRQIFPLVVTFRLSVSTRSFGTAFKLSSRGYMIIMFNRMSNVDSDPEDPHCGRVYREKVRPSNPRCNLSVTSHYVK